MNFKNFSLWFKSRKKLMWQVMRWKQEARYWRMKYENAKKWIEDIHDEFHSLEG